MPFLDALRTVVALANERHPYVFRLQDCDPDLAREAGMDGNLARLLQAARELDLVDTYFTRGEDRADDTEMPETHVVVWALDGFDTDTGESERATYALEAEHLPVGMYIRRGAKREGVRCLVLAADNPVVTFARIYSSSITNMEVIQ